LSKSHSMMENSRSLFVGHPLKNQDPIFFKKWKPGW